MLWQGLRINEVRVVFQQGSDDFRELIKFPRRAQAHSFEGHARRAGFEEEVEAHFAQEGEVGGSVAAAAALEVFPEDDVKAPVQAVLHLPVLAHTPGDEFGIGLEAGDKKAPPDGGLAGNEVEGLALAQGEAGEAAPLPPAGKISDFSGDPTASDLKPAMAFFNLLHIGRTTGGEGFEERVDFFFGFGLVAFEIEDVVAFLGVDVAGEAVLAVGGIPTEDDPFELKVAQEKFALGAFAAGFGDAALGQTEAFLRAPKVDRGGHLERSRSPAAAAPEGFAIAGNLPQGWERGRDRTGGRGTGSGGGRKGRGIGVKELAHPETHGVLEGVGVEEGEDAGESVVAGRPPFERDDGAQPCGFIAGEVRHIQKGVAA